MFAGQVGFRDCFTVIPEGGYNNDCYIQPGDSGMLLTTVAANGRVTGVGIVVGRVPMNKMDLIADKDLTGIGWSPPDVSYLTVAQKMTNVIDRLRRENGLEGLQLTRQNASGSLAFISLTSDSDILKLA